MKEALGSDTSSSESESEDENGELLSKTIEDEFYKIIPMIAQKDKRIYDPKAKFFPSDEEKGAQPAFRSFVQLKPVPEDDEAKADDVMPKKEKKKEKALYVSDYLRERLLTKGAEDAEKSDDVRAFLSLSKANLVAR